MSNGRKPNRGQVNVVVQMVVFILAIGLLALLAARQIDRIMNPRRAGAVLTESLAAAPRALEPETVRVLVPSTRAMLVTAQAAAAGKEPLSPVRLLVQRRLPITLVLAVPDRVQEVESTAAVAVPLGLMMAITGGMR